MKKYEVSPVPDLIMQDGKGYNVWKVSDSAGFYLGENICRESASELLDSIVAKCSALKEQIKAGKLADSDEGAHDGAATDIFDELKKEADESLELKNGTRSLEEKLPYLIRKRTGEKIVIDRNIFKLGKDAGYVDYFVDDNPTISRSHADIIRKSDAFYVKDKGSLNHTFVDGRKLEPEKAVKLEPGSLLQLSDEVFEFLL
ncbi:MAG: FHA domain-containing protein [Lachnospiraceae bacterium]|nr:FHA domain-containing protein [Lachnospiraceae bacterium]